MFSSQNEKAPPLTLGEFQELMDAIPKNKREPGTKVQIVGNEERICMKDATTALTIAWIKRNNPQPATFFF
jgi:hypothetical protein